MTILLIEGFETYTNALNVNVGAATGPGKWTGGSFGIRNDAVRTGTRNGRGESNFNPEKLLTATEEHATLIVGFYHNGGYGVDTDIVRFKSDAGATTHVTLRRTSASQLVLQVGGVTVAGPTTGATLYGHYIEMKATLADSGGSITLYRDGSPTPILSFTGDTKNGGTKTVFDMVQFAAGSFQTFDDIYIANGAGPAPYNDVQGDVRVWPLNPNGNGATNQGVGSDGNSVDNYLLVDDTYQSASDADYVGITTDGNVDLYAYQNLTPTTGTVLAVSIASRVAKSDAGTKSYRPVIRHSGTNYPGNDLALSTAYAVDYSFQTTNPGTGAGWTIADVNNAEFGFEARP